MTIKMNIDKIKYVMTSDRFKNLLLKFNDKYPYLKKTIEAFDDLPQRVYVISIICETDRDLKDEYYFNSHGSIKISERKFIEFPKRFIEDEFYNLFEELLNEILDDIQESIDKAKDEYGVDLSTPEGRKELFYIKSKQNTRIQLNGEFTVINNGENPIYVTVSDETIIGDN